MAGFEVTIEGLTIGGKVEAKDAESGFALFVSFTHGTWNPEVVGDCVHVRVRVSLTTGEKLQASGRIPVTRDAEFFEGLVPGILEQIRHPSAWNLPVRFRVQPNQLMQSVGDRRR